jgi:hypothetical protein
MRIYEMGEGEGRGTQNRTTKPLGHPVLAGSSMQVKHNITILSSQYSCSYVSQKQPQKNIEIYG